MKASSVIYMTNSLSPDYTIRGLINMDSIGGGRKQKEGARQGKMRAPLRQINWNVGDRGWFSVLFISARVIRIDLASLSLSLSLWITYQTWFASELLTR